MNILVGNRVIHKRNRKTGKVIEVNNYWGWFQVQFEDGHKKRYDNHMRNHEITILNLDNN